MGSVNKSTLCPVCGYNLGFEAWKGELPSHEFCASCGIQFGYHDVPEASGAVGTRKKIHLQWRRYWIDSGMVWSSHGIPKPTDWNPREQLKRIGVKIWRKNCGQPLTRENPKD